MSRHTPTTIFVSAGGTGGGIYPALTVAAALQKAAPDANLHYIGSVGGMEEKLVPRAQFAGYHGVQGGPLHGVSLPRKAFSALKIAFGILQAFWLALRLRPAALFLTGGWATFPPAVGCWLRGVPILIYMPDIEPALVIRVISRIARLTLTPVAESTPYFPPGVKTEPVGYPLRDDLLRATREAGIAQFGLDPARRTILVMGGSRGARRLNEALAVILSDIVAEGAQVIHVSGELDWPGVAARQDTLPAEIAAHYHPFAYLKNEMGLALAAADLAVSRAGASILGEYPHFGLPSILIPLAFAWRYQQVNADWLAAHGAAIRLDDAQVRDALLPLIGDLLRDPARLAEMGRACAALRGQDVAGKIAARILELARR